MTETEPVPVRVEYRNWLNGMPPRRVKLDVGKDKPGWAGESTYAVPQPWHCKPWSDAATYGLELVYSWKSECVVTADDKGKCYFEADFSGEIPDYLGKSWSPFAAFAPFHFGYVAMVDLKPPAGHGILLQPHPRAAMDMTGEVPFATPGLLEMDWWPEIFFMVFRAPYPGKKLVFRHGDPIASYLVVPKNVKYDIVEMPQEDAAKRAQRQSNLETFWHRMCSRVFYCADGEEFFDNKYKVLSNIAKREGNEAVCRYMDNPKLLEHWDKEKSVVDSRPEDKRPCLHAMRPEDGARLPDPTPEAEEVESLDVVDEMINRSGDMDDAELERLVQAFKKQRRRDRTARSQRLKNLCDPNDIKFKDHAAEAKANIAKAEKGETPEVVLGHKMERLLK